MRGVIESFDYARGDGWFVAESGRRFYFHCVTIADGSRTIPVGAAAIATPHVGHLGVDEVTAVAVL
jgi:hypothetical protein